MVSAGWSEGFPHIAADCRRDENIRGGLNENSDWYAHTPPAPLFFSAELYDDSLFQKTQTRVKCDLAAVLDVSQHDDDLLATPSQGGRDSRLDSSLGAVTPTHTWPEVRSLPPTLVPQKACICGQLLGLTHCGWSHLNTFLSVFSGQQMCIHITSATLKILHLPSPWVGSVINLNEPMY